MPGWISDVQGYREILDAGGNPVARRKMLQVTGATVTDDGTKTIIAVPPGATGTAGATGATGATGVGFNDQNAFVLKEDFAIVQPSGATSGVFSGDRCPWTLSIIGGTASVAQRGTQDTNHPGQLSWSVGPTSGESAIVQGVGDTFTRFDGFSRITFVYRTPAAVAGSIIALGIGAVQALNAASSSCFFYADTATSANWRARTRDGSSQTANVDTGVAIVTSDWIVLQIERNVSTNDLTFRIDGATVATVLAATHSIDASDEIKISAYYDNNSAAVAASHIDLILYESAALTRST